MNYERAASELVRALRGKRSQPALSRRLGYESNVIYTWESGRGFPTASIALKAARRAGVSIHGVFERFYGRPPRWFDHVDPASREGVAAFLNDIRGGTSVVDVAKASEKSRFAVARWLKGQTEPRLPDFLRLVECCSLRLLDFLECMVAPDALPSIRQAWKALQSARRLAYDAPWTQAVLRALELRAYQARRHQSGWIAKRVGVTREIEDECLQLLKQSGQVRWVDGRWVASNVRTLDMRKDPEAALRLKSWWGHVALDRAAGGGRGMVYNLFGVSTSDLDRLRALQAAYFNELRTVVAQSEPVEHVCLAAMFLMDLSEPQA